jgi:hypothetical protein
MNVKCALMVLNTSSCVVPNMKQCWNLKHLKQFIMLMCMSKKIIII